MFARTMISLLTVALVLGLALPVVADEALDKAFDALKTYDWGQDRNTMKPIDDAIVKSHGDAAAQKALAGRLCVVLTGESKRCGKDYCCRQLSLIATADNVPAIAPLLTSEELSHMARYALERMPCPEAVKAMRDAMPKAKGLVKVGIINSLGVRRDKESTGALTGLLGDSDKQIAAAAAAALGSIGTTDAAKALGAYQSKAPKELKQVAADAYLACAEQLLADGKKADAMKIYMTLSKSDMKHIGVAAKRGMLEAAKK